MNKTQDKPNIQGIIKAILAAALIAVAGMLVLSLIQALMSQILGIGEGGSKIITYIVWGICSALGGYICLSALKSRGLLYGAVEGFVIFAICLLVGLIATGSIKSFSQIWPNLLIAVASSALGGVFGVNRKK